MTDYVELHCHSNFSLLDGASHPEELVIQAAALGMPALALTDHDAVYGAPRFISAANEQGIRPILGAELTLTGDRHLTLLIENEAGWHNLCYLISQARHTAPKGEAILAADELVGCTNGLIALSGCPQGEVAAALLGGDRQAALDAARGYRELFGPENFWIELQRHYLPGEEKLVPKLAALANYLQLGCVATNNVHYAQQSRHKLQDVLVCISHLTTLDGATEVRRYNSEYYLKSAGQMTDLFYDYPEAIANTKLLADRCQFELKYGLQDLPHLTTPNGMSSSAYLRRLCQEALPERYPDSKGQDNYTAARRQLAHELEVIEQAGLANYFLIVWDIVRFSREEGIRCQGRGSAANSLVAYLLYISPIDPQAHDLVFERFLSAERQVVPDIDIDFDAQRREEVIQYVYTKYGADHTAMACTFVTFRSRSAIRDVSKVLDMPPEIVAAATETLEVTINGQKSTSNEQKPITNSSHRSSLRLLLDLAQEIEGFPRHLGIHSGGMIITGSPLMGRVPTELATMPDRWVVQWDKDGLEETGLVKIDILGLRMLSAITECTALIEETSGINPDLGSGLARHTCRSHALSFTDPAVYEMIGQADTIGAFQVESRAQAQMLPKLKPQNFNDLVVAISLIRPGPIQGNMVHPFLRRRQGLEPVTYAHPSLEPALAETLGVILFQEQVLKIARDLAGFTAGQGEQLRRALGSKRATEAIERFHTAFLEGAQAQGISANVANKVFDQLRAFGGYSFAKSHAAAFAVLVYQSAWLKRHHFVLFTIALLNNQPMGFWTPAVLVNEAKRKGIQVLPVDIYQSQAICTLGASRNEDSIRLGFNYVKSLREEHIERILTERKSAPFDGLADFYQRVRPGRRETENLIMTGAMDGWGLPRRQLLWELGTLHDSEDEFDLIFSTDEVTLPTLSPAEAMLGEQEVLGLSTGEQIMSFYRTWLSDRDILDSQQVTRCADGQRVCVAGLVVVHQAPPTAKGFHFITLEDESGMMNIIVRPQVYDQYRRTLRGSRLLLVEGMVQQEDGVSSILARRAAVLSVVS